MARVAPKASAVLLRRVCSPAEDAMALVAGHKGSGSASWSSPHAVARGARRSPSWVITLIGSHDTERALALTLTLGVLLQRLGRRADFPAPLAFLDLAWGTRITPKIRAPSRTATSG